MANSELLVGLMAVRDHLVSPDEFKNATRQWHESQSPSFLDILKSVRSIDDGVLRSLKQYLAHYLQTASESEIFAARLADQLNLTDCLIGGPHSSQTGIALAASDLFSDDETEQYAGKSNDSTDGRVFSGSMQRTKISRFQNIRRYREGGLGTISLAFDSDFHRLIALKQIRSDKSGNDLVKAKFEFEAAVTGQLEHPGVVPIYSKGLDESDQPYYAMKFIRGNTLGEEINEYHNTRKELPGSQSLAKLRSLLRRFVDVCETMAYAHSRGVLHRDLKPDNIMLGKYGETLVVDWGLAKAEQATRDQHNTPVPSDEEVGSISISSEYHQYSEMLAGSFQGTLTHASPEQLRAIDGQLSVRSDIYSLGVILHKTLTGKLPTERQPTPEAMADAIKNRTPDWSDSGVSKALAAICDKALAYDPSNRYESAESLRDDVQNWLDDQPVSAHKDSWRETAGRWTRNHPRLAASLLVGALAVLGFGVAVSMVQQQAEANRLLANKQYELELAKQDKKASLESALRYAITRANFLKALEITEEIEVIDNGLTAGVSLDRAECFFGLQDTEKSKEALASVVRNQLTERNQARYDLLDALIHIDTDEASDSSARKKLDTVVASGQLLVDEVEFAKGLLALSNSEAIEHFLASRDANPYRADNHVYLAMNQIVAGRLLDAEQTLNIAKLIVADDPRLEFEQALIYALRGDVELTRKATGSLPQSPEWTVLREVADLLALSFNDINNMWEDGSFLQNFSLINRFASLGAKMLTLKSESTIRLPMTGHFRRAKQAMDFPNKIDAMTLGLWYMRIQRESMTSRMLEVFPDHPLMLSMQASLLTDSKRLMLDDAGSLIDRANEIDDSWPLRRKLDALSQSVINLQQISALPPDANVRSKWRGQRNVRPNIELIVEQTNYFEPTSQPLAFDVVWLLMLKTCNISEAFQAAESALGKLKSSLPEGIESNDEIQLWEKRIAATEKVAETIATLLTKTIEESKRPIVQKSANEL